LSPLTKIFVVLHVVLSMLLAAAVITFVNTVDDYRQASVQTKAELVSAQTRANEAISCLLYTSPSPRDRG
jgi:heme A synthase